MGIILRSNDAWKLNNNIIVDNTGDSGEQKLNCDPCSLYLPELDDISGACGQEDRVDEL